MENADLDGRLLLRGEDVGEAEAGGEAGAGDDGTLQELATRYRHDVSFSSLPSGPLRRAATADGQAEVAVLLVPAQAPLPRSVTDDVVRLVRGRVQATYRGSFEEIHEVTRMRAVATAYCA